MKYARVGDHRREAVPDLSGECPRCESLMIPKCGSLRVWHWAHRGARHCDPWWEETDWHLGWKNKFPAEWQEVLQSAADGEKHFADVKAPDGRVIEFQHSPLADEERRSREAFYVPMVWVVDGLRRKRDRQSFYDTLRLISREPLVYTGDVSECALLRDWTGRPVDVFFDFGSSNEEVLRFGVPILWRLHPNPQGRVLLTPIRTAYFVEVFHKSIRLKRIRIVSRPSPPVLPRPLFVLPPPKRWRRGPESFQQYLRRRERSRPRF